VALTPVEIEVEGERYQATPPVVLGRAQGAGSQNVLAVKTSDGRELYVFKGVYARFGCAGSDTDCTSHTQLKIAVEGGTLIVKNVGKFPAYSQGQPIDRIVLGPGQWAELNLPGVYTHDGKKARIVIKTPGAITPTESAGCEVLCRVWIFFEQLYSWVEGRSLNGVVENLVRGFSIIKGDLEALVILISKRWPNAVERLMHSVKHIEHILRQLKQNSPDEIKEEIAPDISFIRDIINDLRQELACRC